MGCTGVALLAGGLIMGAHHSVFLVGLVLALCGAVGAFRDDEEFRLGRGMIPAAVFAVALIGIVTLNGSMWQAYEPRDARFWQYFFNTVYLMLGMPLSIAASLGLAILLSDSLPTGTARQRIILCKRPMNPTFPGGRISSRMGHRKEVAYEPIELEGSQPI